jgi:putative ABC transport system ATP-binding protein
MSDLLVTEKLTRRYVMGETIVSAVDGIDLTFHTEEISAIVGRSGSGKSTLLHLLGGLDRPTSGDISIQDRRMSELTDDELALLRRDKFGFIFQFFNLIPTRNALQNVELPLVLSGVPIRERREQAMKFLCKVGLESRAEHKPQELSGGEQQRVAIARALVLNPPLLLADEPTGNLDTKTSEEIVALLHQIQKEGEKSIILVTHDRELAETATDRVIEMRDGTIVDDRRSKR